MSVEPTAPADQREVVVRVPATSANLGPGFDALGLALELHDEVTGRVIAGPDTVTVVGEGADTLATDGSHLVVRAMRAACDAIGVTVPGVALTCHNRIPQGRGLGSSSAAIVAGILLARALVPAGARLDDGAALRLAAQLEGHPDNVAPCLFGGLTIAWRDRADAARAVRLTPVAGLSPVLFVPERVALTAAARAVLPEVVPHADAAHAAGRAALLVHALTAAPELLLPATEDRLHQGYRATGMPEATDLLAELRRAGVAAVISGAGPSVLALSPVPPRFRPPHPVTRWDLSVDFSGAVVEAAQQTR